MKSKEKGQTGRWVIPAAFVVAAGLVITGLYTGLKTKIEAREADSLLELRQQVVPGADRFEPLDLTAAGSGISDKVEAAFLARKDGQTIGILFQAEESGHEGPIVSLIGVDAQTLTLTGVRVTESEETLGLGDGLSDPDYYQQFVGLGGPDSQLQVYAAGDLPEETTAASTDGQSGATPEETTAASTDGQSGATPEETTATGADGQSGATPEETTAASTDGQSGATPEETTAASTDGQSGATPEETTAASTDGQSGATPEETTAASTDGQSGATPEETTAASTDGQSGATPEETTAAGAKTEVDADSSASKTDSDSQTLIPVEALSQATVSSKALVRAINACLSAADVLKEGGWLK
ncbi:hypothetical protein HCH52_01880 [Oscillospiraceae bacterium HV4-5-C5C]|nr:hypothetical protein [Oscillospiraceae bacterium HV4-5-C5C]